eukprot:9477318-Pyramimonas_sp.AAC.1
MHQSDAGSIRFVRCVPPDAPGRDHRRAGTPSCNPRFGTDCMLGRCRAPTGSCQHPARRSTIRQGFGASTSTLVLSDAEEALD